MAKSRRGMKTDPLAAILGDEPAQETAPAAETAQESAQEAKRPKQSPKPAPPMKAAQKARKPYGVPLSSDELEELRDWSIQIDKPVSHIIQDAVSEKLQALRSEHGEVKPRKRNPRVGRPFGN